MTWTSTSQPYITPPPPGQSDAWTRSGGTQRLLDVGVIPAPDDVAAALQLEPGADVVRRARLIIKDDQPIEVSTSYWPATWAADTDLARARPVKGGTVRLVAECGWRLGQSVEDTGALLADGENVPQAPAGAALFVLLRTMYDVNDVAYEYQTNFAWDGHRQRYVIKAQDAELI